VITIFGTLHLNPARRDEALNEFQDLVAETRLEPGCGAYVVSADLADPTTLYIFEEWAGPDALDSHRRSAHFVEHQARAAGHIAAAEISQYESGSAERRSVGS
jgi:quinol monooxygenase YgiN